MPPFSEFLITANVLLLLAERLFCRCELECAIVTVRKGMLGTPDFVLSTIYFIKEHLFQFKYGQIDKSSKQAIGHDRRDRQSSWIQNIGKIDIVLTIYSMTMRSSFSVMRWSDLRKRFLLSKLRQTTKSGLSKKLRLWWRASFPFKAS